MSRHCIVYVTDLGFLAQSCFSAVSAQQASADIPLQVYFLMIGVSEIQRREARAYLAAQGISATLIDLPSEELDGLPRPKDLPMATYGRLVMDHYLPQDIERLIYIDGDTLVSTSLKPLFDWDLGDKPLGAVVDIGRSVAGKTDEDIKRLNLGPEGYFNAGVLVMDWAKWHSAALGQGCLEALRSNPASRFPSKDQCALNLVCANQWQPLPLQYNCQPVVQMTEPRETALFHFLGKHKPWASKGIRHPWRFVAAYKDFYLNSPWADQWPKRSLQGRAYEMARWLKEACTPKQREHKAKCRLVLSELAAKIRLG